MKKACPLPPPGMDPYSRRSTWEMLQNARAGRIICITTHHMDEADILGDRVTIMGRGKVRCAGTPNFLKRHFGVGYVLSCVRAPGSDPRVISDEVQRHVPAADVSSNVGAELTFHLPLDQAPKLPALFAALDTGSAFGVESYALSITSMESVFLKIARHDDIEATTLAATKIASPATTKSAVARPQQQSEKPTEHSITEVRPSALSSGPGRPDSETAGGALKGTPGAENVDGVVVAADTVRERALAAQEPAWSQFARHFTALGQKRLRLASRDRRGCLFQFFIPIGVVLIGMAVLANPGMR